MIILKQVEPQLVKVGEAWYDVYIGRNPRYGDTKWGNPFRIGIDGNRDEVVAKYEAWVVTQKHLMDSLSELIGKILGCHCEEDELCHGKILIKLIKKRFAMVL